MCAVQITTVIKNGSIDPSAFNITVSPNPFNSIVQFSLPSLFYSSINIQIFNTLGAVVKTINPSLNTVNFEYDLSELTNGIYFIKATTSQGTQIKKVIKQ
jgi:hypothetical protein